MPHALYGDGPSKVIALHGWLGDRHAFDALVPSLDQRAFTFAIPDIRGYGNLKQQPAKQIGPATPSGCPTTRTKSSSCSAERRSTKCCLCGRGGGGDAEISEQGVHVAAEGFVVAVDTGPGRGWASASRNPDAGEDGADDLVTKGEQAGNGAGR
jgi:hypothetical protein